MTDKDRTPDDPLKFVGDLVTGLARNLSEGADQLRARVKTDLEQPGADPTGLLRAVCGIPVDPPGTPGSWQSPRGGSRPATTTTHDETEPPTEVFEEPDHILILADVPGVVSSGGSAILDGRVLRLRAQSPRRRYRKDVELPPGLDPARVAVACHNGVMEVRIDRG